MKKKPLSNFLWFGIVALSLGAVLGADYLRTPKSASAVNAELVVVYKSATCHCCSKWIEHLRQAGFEVEVHNENDLDQKKRQLGVPEALSSCHTALVGGYVVEGHVPADDIRRLLSERPKAVGIAVPGMPIGSPGMEMGNRIDPYEVVLFDGIQPNRVFAKHVAP